VKQVKFIDRLCAVADGYDLFLLDQWGVLHNGAAIHPGACEALQALRAAGKSVVLISNSSRRASVSEEGLERMGIERDLYDRIVTSGELAWSAMKRRDEPYYAGLGRRCMMFTWGGDKRFLDGLDFEAVESMDEADFVLLSGTSGASVADYEPALRQAAQRGLPMVCLNRDLVSVDPEGRLVDCSGKLAQRYEALGGAVRYHGKPGIEIYQACLDLAPRHQSPIAIGDSLPHDIAGANGAGIDSILVIGGIHAFDLELEAGAMPAPDRLAALCATWHARPTYAMPRLVW
jgi:HAD superfamily hydrolase (TIGR01459 family)